MAGSSGQPLCLLIPTVRSPAQYVLLSPSPPSPPTRSPRIKPTTGRLSGVRSRSGSATATGSGVRPSPGIWGCEEIEGMDGERWIGRKYRFEVIVERMELTGYQVYAVEKWIVERTRPVTVLTVYTGDPSHKIVVTGLGPVATMTYTQAEAEFKAAVQHLRKQDGARPKEIPQGTLMVTSLAHFRSDYTIVHIPDGDFLAAQERLYSNINLLRMGCSGRSAVTLEEPSDTTKDRFKSTYLLSDGSPPVGAFRAKVNSRTHTRTYSHTVTTLSLSVPEASTAPPSASHQLSGISLSHPNTSQTGVLLTQGGLRHPHFASYVLEFVKLLQAALAICGMFPLSPPHLPGPTFDGLLCDVTVDGLRRWVTEIGESLIGFESTERIADPSVVAALLSFVLSTRNKLASSVQSVPKDPFLHPYEFLCVLSSYVHSQPVTNNVSTPMLPALIASQLPGQPGHSFPGHGFGNGSATSSATSPVVPNLPFVTPSASNLPLSSTPVVYPHSISSPTTIHVSPLIPIPITYLTLALHTSLLSQHDAKLRDSRKVHRALLSKLELTSDSEATDDERKGLGGRVMGLVGRVSVSGLGGAGPGTVGAPTADLGILVRGVVSGREREREKGREREKERERERDKDRQIRDGESLKERVDGAEEERIGGSLRMLWSGKVEALVRLRERAEGMGWVHRERERERERVWDKEGDRGWEKDKDRLMLSDVDDAVQKNMGEDELAFGGVWSGKVQKKLDMWARINRSKKSVDLLPPIKSVGRMSSVAIPLSAQSSSSGHVYPASELKGLGVPAVVLSHDNGEEDELLSSGQVSPISVSRTHNPLILRPSNDVSSADLPDAGKDKPLDESLAIRELVRDGEMGEMGRGGERGGSRGEMWWRGQVLEDDIMKKGKQVDRQEVGRMLSHRRHTFNDFHSVRDVPVLRTDRMCMDVELCGQILVMRRREAHLEGVVKCLEHLTTVLAHNSTSLRAAYTAHKPMVEALTSRSSPSIHYQSHTHLGESTTSPVTLSPTSPTPLISPTLPTSPHYTSHSHSPPGLTPLMAALHALPVPPPVPALQYEAAQLRVDDMWASAREARRKVWELRGVMFGRESVLGVGGAGSGAGGVGGRGRRKGRRKWTSQWRLDGSECPVDAYGRTESEAEEERGVAAGGDYSEGEDETESEAEFGVGGGDGGGDGGADEGEREAMGPMWLLRVFTSWGARLGFLKRGSEAGGTNVPVTREPSPGATAAGSGS